MMVDLSLEGGDEPSLYIHSLGLLRYMQTGELYSPPISADCGSTICYMFRVMNLNCDYSEFQELLFASIVPINLSKSQ